MKHALVTGAGSGIGAAIARSLLDQGYRVSLLGRRLEALQATVADYPERYHCATCDVTDPEQVSSAFSSATDVLGPIDILVNCAGAAPTNPFHKMPATQWQQVIDVNLNAVYHCCAQVVGDMRSRGWGRIINIASTASLKGYAYVSAYCAAKHGVLGLTRALALELAQKGVTVNAICPGYTDTDIIRTAVAGIVDKTGRTEAEALRTFTDTNPQGRLIEPQEIADTVLWLCTDSTRSITGQALSISGGETG
ncbi:MAG: SDR family NAD(P)-dependent oxidoreductase [Haliea sp.]